MTMLDAEAKPVQWGRTLRSPAEQKAYWKRHNWPSLVGSWNAAGMSNIKLYYSPGASWGFCVVWRKDRCEFWYVWIWMYEYKGCNSRQNGIVRPPHHPQTIFPSAPSQCSCSCPAHSLSLTYRGFTSCYGLFLYFYFFFFSKIHSYSFSVQRFVFKLLKFFINFSVSGDCSLQQMGKVAVTLHANLSVYPSVRILFIVLFILPSSIQNICFQMLLTSPFVYG